MKTQIPIYRALSLGTNEYIEGYLLKTNKAVLGNIMNGNAQYVEGYFIVDENNNSSNIDISTLSVHFPDIIDSYGTRIFASLSKDGKGGDICNHTFFNGDNHRRKSSDTAKFNGIYGINHRYIPEKRRTVKVIGIQES